MFTHLAPPLALALLAAPLVFLLIALATGAWQKKRSEAREGIRVLCGMRWIEFSKLVRDMLSERELQPSTEQRTPGQDGFDLLLVRGTNRYLVQCRNGAAQKVTAASVGQLYTLTQVYHGDGAIIVSCGAAEAAALQLARERRIEVIAGQSLWEAIKPWVSPDVRESVEARARQERRKRLLTATLSGLLSAILAYALVARLSAPAPATSPATAVATTPAAPPATAPPDAGVDDASEVVEAIPLPDTALTPEELESRRAATLRAVRALPRVSSAIWTARSTLRVQTSEAMDETSLTALVEEVCQQLLAFEELRFTRLQIDIPDAQDSWVLRTRWRQCR